MTKYYLYGLTGLAGVGKDTVADLLVTHCGFRKLAFADALRGEVSNGFGVDLVYFTHLARKNVPMGALSMRKAPLEFRAVATLYIAGIPRNGDGTVSAEWLDEPRTPRQIMQWWGTEYRRNQQPAYWSRLLLQRVVDMMRDGANRFVVTDCRFDNEVDTVRTMGGTIWQVKRPGIDASTTAEGTHVSASDGSQFEPEHVLDNLHDIGHLQQLVLSAYVSDLTGIRGVRVTVPA